MNVRNKKFQRWFSNICVRKGPKQCPLDYYCKYESIFFSKCVSNIATPNGQCGGQEYYGILT